MSLTTRQKQRIMFFPFMVLILILALALVAIFEKHETCQYVKKMGEEIHMNHLPFKWIMFCNIIVIVFTLGATIGVCSIRKPNEIGPLTCATMSMLMFFLSVFVGYHFHTETHKIENGLLRFNKNVDPFKIPFFNEREYTWLEVVQTKLNCCGLEGYYEYKERGAINIDNFIHKKPFALLLNEHVPKSCCKLPSEEHCNENIFNDTKQNFNTNDINDDITKIYPKGCKYKFLHGMQECLPIFWVMACLPLIIGIPSVIVTYIYTRHAQGIGWQINCSNARRIPDPELIVTNQKRRKSTFKEIFEELDKISPEVTGEGKKRISEVNHEEQNETGTAVYNVIEHLPLGHTHHPYPNKKKSQGVGNDKSIQMNQFKTKNI